MRSYNNLNLTNDIDRNHSLLLESIKDKKILIIGGAGSIGASYIKEILRYEPSKITVVDNNENALTELTRDLRSSYILDYRPEYITYPVNLLSDTFEKVFDSEYWDIVANFSAHKHVRSEKDGISVEALIKNNVFGIIKILKLCEKNPPNHFFSVSTDKAANPINIMGASKSLMEKLILSKKNKFRVSTARFANVAFSNGSLLDGFTHRLNKSQPLSCPSDIKRFFVTHEQSGRICLLATFLGESGNVFFPKLDAQCDQIYFKDLAIDFLREKGFEPEYMASEKDAKGYDFEKSSGKYPIYLFETDTSGEKEYEEFFTKAEKINLHEYESLGYVVTDGNELSFDEVINSFSEVFETSDKDKRSIVKVLQRYLPEFHHKETGKSLDEKM